MQVIEQSYKILTPINREEILRDLEIIGRTCYKSEALITEASAERFINAIVNMGHESILEHFNITIRYITDRGISHQIVRHRIASYAQESTRYCNYGKKKFGREITVIRPPGLFGDAENSWYASCAFAEMAYLSLLESGVSAEIARAVLPTCLKTELVVTMNLRELRHFLALRTSKEAHPQVRHLLLPLLTELKEKLPEIFSDIRPTTQIAKN